MDDIRVLPLLTKGEVYYSKKKRTDVDTMREMEIIAEAIRLTNSTFEEDSYYTESYYEQKSRGFTINFRTNTRYVGDIMDLRNDLVRDYDFVESIDWFSLGDSKDCNPHYSFVITLTKGHNLNAYEFSLFHRYVRCKLESIDYITSTVD